MRREVRRDLSDSARAFKYCVWPMVKKWCKAGDLFLTEETSVVNPVLSYCDQYSGIDAWQILHGDRRVRGIASRVQFGAAWKSLTIRYRRMSGATTEYEKRLQELKNPSDGYIGPGLTVQAYCDARPPASQLLHAVMVRTSELYEYAERHARAVDNRTNPSDGNLFKVIWWPHMKAQGYKVRQWTNPTTTPRYAGPHLQIALR